ncbi:MAG: TusE/DsrC/DsvC family sulfur relay protein [Desulfobulbaceae bacterium]|nr:TusE/DsrC/DsvC family sulfur relay protein [Desulfobulbaceae bacterium]
MQNSIQLGETVFSLDFKGYLETFSLWTPQLMEWFAQREQVELSREHIALINYIRYYFEKNKVHPVVRVVATHMAEIFGKEKGTIQYFHTLFPKGIHQAYKIAGLPPVVLSV